MVRPLSLFLFAASMLLGAAQVEGHEVADSGRCANPCECRATQARPKSVAGRALVQCMRRGRPIMLEHVIVRGDIDLSGIPMTRMTGGRTPRVVGMDKPRDQLDLDELEREIGTVVDGAVVIRAPVVIRNSSVCGRLLNASRGKDRRIQVPAVFIDSVMLTDSTFHSEVDLSRSRFQRPVRLDRSTFIKGLSLRYSRFNSNAFFSSVNSQGTVTLADTRFARGAIFTGMSVQGNGTADFRHARFDNGAAFDMDGAKKTTLHLADFSEAEFAGAEANFQDAEFQGINFTKARVKTVARFDRARFMEPEAVSFTQATFDSDVVFDDAVFHPVVSFFAASFSSERPISFDRVIFDHDARWDQARFAGPVTFVGARAVEQLSFVDAELRGTFDVRRSTIAALVIGGKAASARIGGEALFDHAGIGWAALDNTNFVGRASFIGTRFGQSAHCRPAASALVVSLANTRFAGAVDFSEARFQGLANLAHLSVEPGKLRWRWTQLKDKLVAEPEARLVVGSEPERCPSIETDPQQASNRREANAEMLRWIEKNFKAQDYLDDAARVTYVRETAEATQVRLDEHQSWWTRAWAALTLGVYGYLLGFGVRPWLIAVEMFLVFIAGAVCYYVSGKPLDSNAPDESPFEWIPGSLPYKEYGTLFTSRDAKLAAAVSLAALTTIRYKGAYIVLAKHDRMRVFVLFERLVGYLLLYVLGISLSSTMPVLHKLLGWLPGF